MEFTTETIFEALKGPLGVIDDEERRAKIESYVEAARLPLERSVFDLLSEFAREVNNNVSSHYEVTLGYEPGVLNLEVREREPSEPPEETWTLAEGEVEKITLRIPAELKDLATQAAAKASLSVNAWFVRVLARALRSAEAPEPPEHRQRGHRRAGRVGRRLTGWIGDQGSEE